MTDYRPVACEIYAELELAILRHKRLRLVWRDCDGTHHVATLRPKDLLTRQHEEFLISEDSEANLVEIRLDRIVRFDPIDP